jgi:hypothetical protein
MTTRCPSCNGFVDDVSIEYKIKEVKSGSDTCHVRPCGCRVTRSPDRGAFASLERLKGRKNAQKKKRQGKPGRRGR